MIETPTFHWCFDIGHGTKPSFNENAALGRTFRFGERRSFGFRAEAFNVLNRVRWGGANNSITGASFGRVTTRGGSGLAESPI